MTQSRHLGRRQGGAELDSDAADDDDDDELDDDDDDDFYNSDELESDTALDCEPAKPAERLGSRERQREPPRGRDVAANAASQTKAKTKPKAEIINSGSAARQQAANCQQVNDSWFVNYHGIIVILPIIFNAFQDKQLERQYQRYSHGQRQRSLVIAHLLDLALKVALLAIPLASLGHRWQRHGPALAAPLQQSDTAGQTIGDYYARFHIINNHSHNTSGQQQQQPQTPLGAAALQRRLATLLAFGPAGATLAALGDQNKDQDQDERQDESQNDPEQPLAPIWLAGWRRLAALVWFQLSGYALSAGFGLANLVAVLVSLCASQRRLAAKLSLLALITWLLMLAQSQLLYASNQSELANYWRHLNCSSNSSPSFGQDVACSWAKVSYSLVLVILLLISVIQLIN